MVASGKNPSCLICKGSTHKLGILVWLEPIMFASSIPSSVASRHLLPLSYCHPLLSFAVILRESGGSRECSSVLWIPDQVGDDNNEFSAEYKRGGDVAKRRIRDSQKEVCQLGLQDHHSLNSHRKYFTLLTFPCTAKAILYFFS